MWNIIHKQCVEYIIIHSYKFHQPFPDKIKQPTSSYPPPSPFIKPLPQASHISLSKLHLLPPMATISTFLSKPPLSSPSSIIKQDLLTPSSNLSFSPNRTAPPASRRLRFLPSPRATTPVTTSGSDKPDTTKKDSNPDARVQRVHNAEEFTAALQAAKNRLVVVEFATSRSSQSKQIYPFMVQLSRTCADVDFVLVMGDESDEARELCRREGIEKVPHFTFYKGMEKIHEEDAIGPDQLMGDVLYYGDNHSSVVQLHSRDDVEGLMSKSREDGKLLVLDVGLKRCGPCVKVYPTVIKLSRSMEDTVVFARMNGDENDSCMQFLKDMDVVQVPTFLFIREGEIKGRYVGSGKGELIGEILRYQGVRVTY